jgi:hypothetical protein
MLTCRCSLIDVFEAYGLRPLRNDGVRDEAVTFGYPRALVFEQRVKDLWLSVIGAVLNGG